MDKTQLTSSDTIIVRRRVLTVFRTVLIGILVLDGALTAWHAFRSETISLLNQILSVIGIIQALAALLLVIRRTVFAAGIAVLVVFLCILVVIGPAGNLHLFVYSAGVILLMCAGKKAGAGD